MGGLLPTTNGYTKGLATPDMYMCSPKYAITTQTGTYMRLCSITKVFRGTFIVCVGTQDSETNLGVIIASVRANDSIPYITTKTLLGDKALNFKYKMEGDSILIAVESPAAWHHFQFISLHPNIKSLIKELTGTNKDGYTNF